MSIMTGDAAKVSLFRNTESSITGDVARVSLFRNVNTQVILMGVVFFCVPGAFNSIIGLNSGIPDSYLNLGYGLLYFIFGAVSLAAPALVNKFGPRTMMCVGGCVYTLFSISLLLCGPLHALPLPVITVCASLVGFGAALMWSGNGAMLLSYPTEFRRASYISTFWVIFNLGAVIGGLQSFVTNLGTPSTGSESGASPVTFCIYIGMGVIGTCAVWLLQPLENVIREDGTRCQRPKAGSVGDEIKGMMSMMCSRNVLALLPLFVYSNWFYSYQLTVFSKGVFMPAASGLAGALYWGAQMVGAKNLGCLLDAKRLSVGQRAWMGIGVSGSLIAIGWVWGISANTQYKLDFQEVSKGGVRELYDFNDPQFIEAALLMTLWGYCDSLVQTWCYWVMTQLYTSSEDFGRIAGIFKFAQSLGAAASFLLSYAHPSASVQIFICIVMFVCSLPGAAYLCTHFSKMRPEA